MPMVLVLVAFCSVLASPSVCPCPSQSKVLNHVNCLLERALAQYIQIQVQHQTQRTQVLLLLSRRVTKQEPEGKSKLMAKVNMVVVLIYR